MSTQAMDSRAYAVSLLQKVRELLVGGGDRCLAQFFSNEPAAKEFYTKERPNPTKSTKRSVRLARKHARAVFEAEAVLECKVHGPLRIMQSQRGPVTGFSISIFGPFPPYLDKEGRERVPVLICMYAAEGEELYPPRP